MLTDNVTDSSRTWEKGHVAPLCKIPELLFGVGINLYVSDILKVYAREVEQ